MKDWKKADYMIVLSHVGMYFSGALGGVNMALNKTFSMVIAVFAFAAFMFVSCLYQHKHWWNRFLEDYYEN